LRFDFFFFVAGVSTTEFGVAIAAAALAVASAVALAPTWSREGSGVTGAAAASGAGVTTAVGAADAVIGGDGGPPWVALKHFEHMLAVVGFPKKPQPFAHN